MSGLYFHAFWSIKNLYRSGLDPNSFQKLSSCYTSMNEVLQRPFVKLLIASLSCSNAAAGVVNLCVQQSSTSSCILATLLLLLLDPSPQQLRIISCRLHRPPQMGKGQFSPTREASSRRKRHNQSPSSYLYSVGVALKL